MKNITSLLVVFVVALSFGCAAKNMAYLPKYAITEPGEAISIPHPIEAQKNGVKSVTVWRGVMNPDLLVEVIDKNGVFPVVGSDGVSEFRGFAYLVDLNFWGDWIIQYEFSNSISELSAAKFVLVNRDGGYAYSLLGERVVANKEKGNNPYDAEKFDTNNEYRQQFIAEFGVGLSELDRSWKNFFASKGIDFEKSIIKEYQVGSEDWVKMVDSVNQDVQSGKLNVYKVGEQIRIGQMNLDQFADKASDVPDFTAGNRFINRAALPVISLASMSLGPLAMAGVGFGGTVYSANIDNDWHGHTLRSKFWGYELAPTFGWACEQYKKLLAGRDTIIERLKKSTTRLSQK